MKKMISDAGKIYLTTALATIICFIIYLSVTTVFYSLGTDNIGYQTYDVTDNNSKVITSEHIFEEGETASYPDGNYIAIRSELPSGLNIAKDVISQALMLTIFVVFLYKPVSTIGAKDRTEVDYNGMVYDKLYGVKVGLIAAIPSIIFYIILIVAYFKQINLLQLEYYGSYIFMPILNNITGGIKYLWDVPVSKLIALFFTRFALPVTCGILYILGYKKIILKDKFMYKKADK